MEVIKMRDPYTDSNNVLKNKLNIKDYHKLNQAEADIGFLKLVSLDSLEYENLDENLIKKIHKHIFEDIFDWAGEYRTVPVVKQEKVLAGFSIPYSDASSIPKNLNSTIKGLDEFDWNNMTSDEIALRFARQLAVIWRVHPFRDGNTRTILSFGYLYAKAHGFPFDMQALISNLSEERDKDGNLIRQFTIRDRFVLASLDYENYPEIDPLAKLMKYAMDVYNENNDIENNKTR
jgi:cell filamentation protein